MREVNALKLLADPVVIEGLRQAYRDSDVGGARPIEQGGFIVRHPGDGSLSIARLPPSARDSLAYPLCSDGTFEGQQIVGSFHTHPNIGQEWQQEPSLQDIRLSCDYPETMGHHQFVLSRDAIYHIDNEGIVTEIGGTSQMLGL